MYIHRHIPMVNIDDTVVQLLLLGEVTRRRTRRFCAGVCAWAYVKVSAMLKWHKTLYRSEIPAVLAETI